MKEAGPILLCPAFIIRYESAAIFRLSYEFTSSGFNPFINLFNPKAPLTANPDSRNIFYRTDPRAIGHGTDIRIFRTFFNGYPLSLNLRYSQPLLTWNPWVTEKKTHLDFLGILRKAWRAFMSRWQSFWSLIHGVFRSPANRIKRWNQSPPFVIVSESQVLIKKKSSFLWFFISTFSYHSIHPLMI